MVFLFNCKGTRSLQKVLCFLTIFPYIEIFVLLFVTLIHPGGGAGIKNFFSPQFKKLLDVSLWRSSFEQCFISIGIQITSIKQKIEYLGIAGVGLGGLFMLGSQCYFRNEVHVNAIALNIIDLVTSISYAMIIYSFMGFMCTAIIYVKITENFFRLSK